MNAICPWVPASRISAVELRASNKYASGFVTNDCFAGKPGREFPHIRRTVVPSLLSLQRVAPRKKASISNSCAKHILDGVDRSLVVAT